MIRQVVLTHNYVDIVIHLKSHQYRNYYNIPCINLITRLVLFTPN